MLELIRVYFHSVTLNALCFSGHTAVSLKDLNISCPVKDGEVPVTLRAVSADEEGHLLVGPSVERKVTCPNKGSYDAVHITQTHISLPMPLSNQYSRNLRSLLLEVLGVSCPHKRDAKSLRMTSSTDDSSNNENYEQSLGDINAVETIEDDLSSLQLVTEGEDERHGPGLGSDIDSHREPNHENPVHHQEELQLSRRWEPFMRQDTFPLLPAQLFHQIYLSNGGPLRREIFLHSIHSNRPDTSLSDAEVLGNIQIQNNGHQNVEHSDIELHLHDSAYEDFHITSIQSQSEPDSGGAEATSNHRPVNVEVSVNASGDNFELKVRGQDSFFKLLQGATFSLHINSANESNFVAFNISRETRPHDHKIYENRPHNHLLNNLNGSSCNVSSHHNNVDADTHQNSAPDLMQHSTNEEVMQKLVLMNVSAEFMELSANNSHNSGSSLEDSHTLTVLVDSVENPPRPSLLSDTYPLHDPHLESEGLSVKNNSSTDSGTESFQKVKAEESTIISSTESGSPINISNGNPYAELGQPDVTYTSTVIPVHSPSKTVDADESNNADTTGHRSRRNVQLTPVTFVQIPQRNNFSLLGFLQSNHKSRLELQAQNTLSRNGMVTSEEGVISQDLKFTEDRREEENTGNNKEFREGYKDESHRYETGQVKSVQELTHARASLIYDLGLKASFNGKIERVSSPRGREASPPQPEDIREVYPAFRSSDIKETRFELENKFSTGGLGSASLYLDHPEIMNSKHSQMALCPFKEVLKALHLLKPEENGYELNNKGSGHSPNILQTILAPNI